MLDEGNCQGFVSISPPASSDHLLGAFPSDGAPSAVYKNKFGEAVNAVLSCL